MVAFKVKASELAKKLKSAQKDGCLIFHEDIALPESGLKVLVDKEDDQKVYLHSKFGDFENVPVKKYMLFRCLTSELPEDPRDRVSGETLKTGYTMTIAKVYGILKDAAIDPGLKDLIRRAFVLARYGVVWSEGIDLLISLDWNQAIAPNVIKEYLRVYDQKFPVVAQDMAGLLLNLEDRLCNHPDDRSNSASLGPMVSWICDYYNPRRLEAPLNSQLWTRLFDALLLPNAQEQKGKLRSTVEYPMNLIDGFERHLSVDYAVILDRGLPIVMCEYASASGIRVVHKDFPKLVIEATSVLLDFIGRNRAAENLAVLAKLRCFLLFVSADEVELAVVKPIFGESVNDECNLKGFALKTDKKLRFALLTEDPATLDEPILSADDVDICYYSLDQKKEQDLITLLSADLLTLMNDISLPQYRTANICPVEIDPESVACSVLRFFRAFGLRLHDYANDLSEALDTLPPPPPDAKGFVYSSRALHGPGTQSIHSTTPLKSRPTTASLERTAERDTKKARKLVKAFLRQKGSFKWKTLSSRASSTTQLLGSATIKGQRAVFLLKQLSFFEEYLLQAKPNPFKAIMPGLLYMKKLSGPPPATTILGLEYLVPFEKFLYRGPDWVFYCVDRLSAMLIDGLLAIDLLASHGWIHGDISNLNIMYCRRSHRFKFIDFGFAQPTSLVLAKFPLGTRPFIDPIVENGGQKSVGSEIFSLASLAEHYLEHFIVSEFPHENWLLTDKTRANVHRIRPVLSLLKTRPSIKEALGALRTFYLSLDERKSVYSCIKKDKVRMKRLDLALSGHSLSASASSIELSPIAPDFHGRQCKIHD